MTHILHISDFHLTGTGTSIWGADVKRNFNYALSRIEKIRDDIDAIFITGDLSKKSQQISTLLDFTNVE